MTVKPLQLPSPEIISSWDKLEKLPLLETIPRAVPFENDISFPAVDEFDYLLGSISDSSSSLAFTYIRKMNIDISLLNNQISKIYPIRSYSQELSEQLRIKNLKKDPKTQAVALQAFNKLIEIVSTEQASCLQSIVTIYESFLDESARIWEKGKYCDLLIDKVCSLIFLLVTLDNLCSSKVALTNDLTALRSLANVSAQDSKSLAAFLWTSTNGPSKSSLIDIFLGKKHLAVSREIEKVTPIPIDSFKNIFEIFYRHIFDIITNKKYLSSQNVMMYIVSLCILYDIYQALKNDAIESKKKKEKEVLLPFENDLKVFLTNFNANHPFILLCYDLNIDFHEFCTVPIDKKENSNHFDLNALSLEMEALAQEFSRSFLQNPVEILPQVLRLVSSAIGTFREIILERSYKLKDPNLKLSGYEMAMNSFSDSELESILHIMTIYRTLREQIEANLPALIQIISGEIQNKVQDLSKNSLELIMLHTKKYPDFKTDFEHLRILTGYFPQEEGDNLNPVEFKKRSIDNTPKGAPHIAAIELLRAQLQIMTNPESPFMQKKIIGGTKFTNDDLNIISTFLNNSAFYSALLKIQDSINECFDQSPLYFREILQDQAKDILQKPESPEEPNVKKQYFSVTASLPYKLTEYAISINTNSHTHKSNSKPDQANSTSNPTGLPTNTNINNNNNNNNNTNNNSNNSNIQNNSNNSNVQNNSNEQNSNTVHVDKGVLISSVFYPMTIYEDAASCALKVLKSQMMFNEIWMESQSCLQQIAFLVSTFAFTSIRDYIQPRITESYFLAVSHKKVYVNEPTRQIAILLQQGQLQLIGNHFNLKSLIATCLDFQYDNAVNELTTIPLNIGLRGIIAFNLQLATLKESHQYFIDHDIPLTAFDEFLRRHIRDDSADSATSKVIKYIIDHTKSVFLPNYLFLSVPSRFLSNDRYDGRVDNLFKNTVSVVSIDHFKEFTLSCGDGAVYLLFQSVLEVIPELFDNLLDAYKQIHQVSRRMDLPIDSGFQGAFERYQNDYKQLINDSCTDTFFKSLQALGNCIVFANMLDIGMSRAHSNQQMMYSYLRQVNPDDGKANITDFYELFNSSIEKKYFEHSQQPPQNEICGPFLIKMIHYLIQHIEQNQELFMETSPTITVFPSLTGFASIWSVMEFVYCLKESISQEKHGSNRSFAAYGEGVIYAAAMILVATRQVPLARICSIGRKMEAHIKVNRLQVEGTPVESYWIVHKMEDASMNLALSLIKNAIRHIQ